MKTISTPVNRTSFYLGLLFFATVLCLFSCKKDDTPGTDEVKGEAKVKMINASNKSGQVDFYLDDTKINVVTVNAGQASDYVKVQSGVKSTYVAIDGVADTPTSFNFVPTLSYTSFYVEDKTGKGEVLTFEDNLGATDAGKAKVRIINLGPSFSNALNVNLAGGVLLVNSLPFKGASGYFSIEPDVDLNISVLGSSANKTIAGSEFEAGKIYTIWINGASNATLKINKVIYN
ncbi:DUF4397 domain-containing protein [Pedobacter sp. KR3-3]|uniref:DUF4397 domain-containing protein n=1 Tax=Pedobacter albus TaxID=3113905 RepID=A0ABU7I6C3_9SPHI|nr:DUF4397 domain-containing protein [Pedobacter sp. KR3-3]MEE1944993.1 DUF4397 domain-containing protein [Pedobacter sp. KR3-3]